MAGGQAKMVYNQEIPVYRRRQTAGTRRDLRKNHSQHSLRLLDTSNVFDDASFQTTNSSSARGGHCGQPLNGRCVMYGLPTARPARLKMQTRQPDRPTRQPVPILTLYPGPRSETNHTHDYSRSSVGGY